MLKALLNFLSILDCLNGEDEINCSRDRCTETQFYCAQDQRCLQETQVCNGVRNCASGEDEANCQCNEDQFRCQYGGGCVLSSQICDGIYDCADHSDEWNCFVSLDNGSIRARYLFEILTFVSPRSNIISIQNPGACGEILL